MSVLSLVFEDDCAAAVASGEMKNGGANEDTHDKANSIGLPSIAGGPSAHSCSNVNCTSDSETVTKRSVPSKYGLIDLPS